MNYFKLLDSEGRETAEVWWKKENFYPVYSSSLTSLLLFNEQMKLFCMNGLSHAGYVLGNAPHWRSCSFYSVTRPPFPRLFQVALTTVSGKSEYSLLATLLCVVTIFISILFTYSVVRLWAHLVWASIYPEKMERLARMTMYAKTGANKESNVHRSISLGLSNVASNNRARGDI